MADYGAGLLAFGVVVGLLVLLLAFGWVLLARLSAPASPSNRRRVARILLVLGLIWLGYVPVVFMYGGGFVWMLGALEGAGLLALGWSLARGLGPTQTKT